VNDVLSWNHEKGGNMTIDDAIIHAEEVAKRCEFDTDYGIGNHFIDRSGVADVIECGKEHRQLAGWLKELKAVRNAWTQLAETITEIKDNADTEDSRNLAAFLFNYIKVLEDDIMKGINAK
jgi:hypothetical protein